MKTHRFDTLSFVSGLVIAVIGLLFLVPQDPGDIFGFIGDIGSWFWPLLLIAVGVAVLAPVAARSTDHEAIEEPQD